MAFAVAIRARWCCFLAKLDNKTFYSDVRSSSRVHVAFALAVAARTDQSEIVIMLVLVRGDPGLTKAEVIGLDILAARQPTLYSLIVGRLGFKVNAATKLVSQTRRLCI